jgi:hypothetical protein
MSHQLIRPSKAKDSTKETRLEMGLFLSWRVACAASFLCIFSHRFGSATDVSAAGPPATVLVLTDSDFHDAIASHEHLLVAFHTRWCQHCRRLMPEVDLAPFLLHIASNLPSLHAISQSCSTPSDRQFPPCVLHQSIALFLLTGRQI